MKTSERSPVDVRVSATSCPGCGAVADAGALRCPSCKRRMQPLAAAGRSPAKLRRPPGRPSATEHVTAPQAAEVGEGCRHCGGAPAADVEFRAVRGVMRSYHRDDLPGPWCSDCGEATYRSAMNRTLVGAWWGNRSFVGGIGAVKANRKAHRQTRALAAPVRPDDTAGPQDTGRPLWRRSGALVGAAMTLVLVFAGIGIAATVGSTPTDEFEDACVQFDDANENVANVSCGEPNDGKVLDIVETEADCPAATESVVVLKDDADKTMCIDETG